MKTSLFSFVPSPIYQKGELSCLMYQTEAETLSEAYTWFVTEHFGEACKHGATAVFQNHAFIAVVRGRYNQETDATLPALKIYDRIVGLA